MVVILQHSKKVIEVNISLVENEHRRKAGKKKSHLKKKERKKLVLVIDFFPFDN
jgi:hypothetical protein